MSFRFFLFIFYFLVAVKFICASKRRVSFFILLSFLTSFGVLIVKMYIDPFDIFSYFVFVFIPDQNSHRLIKPQQDKKNRQDT